ncbi:MAG: hypothetical protein FJ279_02610 [Planctomycetes bacterium]|nr:hypothetical protein [Planctomycetota bacterium]
MLRNVAALLLCTTALASAAPTEWQLVLPQPKQMQVTGEQWLVADASGPKATLVIETRQEKAKIGAEEINQRMAALGGPALPVVEAGDASALEKVQGLPIVLATCDASELAKAILAECGVQVTAKDPGIQGYVVRFVTFRGRKLALLCGSEPQGTLYAAVTFRWLLEREGDKFLATVCSVRDWPDFKWRGTSCLHQMRRSYPVYGKEGEEAAKALQSHVDWMLRCKLNFMGDYFFGGETVPPLEMAAWMKELNAYALARGIIGEEYQSTNVGYDGRDKGNPRFAKMQHLGDKFFSWSDDELLRKRAREVGEFYAAAGLQCLVLHPQDGGGPMDPELWSQRSEADKARWGDDRAAADAHVFNIFYEEARKRNPSIKVVYVVYPYSATYLDYEKLKRNWPDLTREAFERNGREYFKRIATLIPQDVHICVWLGERERMDEFRAIFSPRPMYYWFLYASGWVDSGWLVTTHRHMGTNYYGHPEDIMATRIDRNAPNFINRMVTCQFAWNTKSEGAQAFTGVYYDFRKDNDEPRVVLDKWGLLACKNLWGAQAGPIIFQAFNKGIIPALIVEPSRVVEHPNRDRRRRGEPALEITADMMRRQAEGCEAAAKALDQVLKMDVKLDDLPERLFVYYLQRTHCLAAYARAHYHLMLATQGVSEGNERKVTENVAAGKAALDAGLADMERVLAITANSPQAKKPMDPRYLKDAKKGIFPVIPTSAADFPKLRQSLEAAERRLADSKLKFEPMKHQGVIKVAIYEPSKDGGSAIGEKSWMMTLEGVEGIEAKYVDDLSLSNLVNYDCLLYPQCNSGRTVGRYEFLEVLKRYVTEAGGGVLFSHNSVGFERSQFGYETTFPQVGLGAEARLDSNKVIVAAEHPITKGLAVGAEGTHSYYDHLTIKPGRRGVVILKDPTGGAVMVAGVQGKGRVIYDGTILLSQHTGPVKAEGFEREVFLNAVRWLAQRK